MKIASTHLLRIGLYVFSSLLSLYARGQNLESFEGTWKLNLEKSSLEQRPQGLTGSTFIISTSQQSITLKRLHHYGAKTRQLTFTLKADGKARRLKLLFKSKLEWIGEALKASIWRKNFSNTVTYHLEESQQVLTADEHFQSKGARHHNIWVFDKARDQ